ncbi:MaoC family dehydratase [Chryseobacterium sp. CT-SW4]|uniref:MaoC family dehydratase n=1 Tax=Chryseobacterium sp. SW-1 TaxID=3157343 RepID=UPI003B026DA4
MHIINSLEEYKSLEGTIIGSSPWHTIDQDQINKFADVTLDHQWIHVDSHRAAAESPYGSTIAHGYLTLSLIPYLWKQIADVRNVSLEINYGIENLKFGIPVKVDSEVSLQATIKSVNDMRGIVKVIVGARLLLRDESKPVYTGNVVFLYHFK